jgi:hypothetical protein
MMRERVFGIALRLSSSIDSPIVLWMSPVVILLRICLVLKGVCRLGWQSLHRLDVVTYALFMLGLRSIALLCAMVSLRLNCVLGLVFPQLVQVFVLITLSSFDDRT